MSMGYEWMVVHFRKRKFGFTDVCALSPLALILCGKSIWSLDPNYLRLEKLDNSFSSTMLLYSDIFNGDEMFSDAFKTFVTSFSY
jgi:hypothetical protein